MTQQLALALRRLRRRPVFAALATATLTIAIGAVASTFGLVNSTLLRPLPYSEPDRLVALRSVPSSSSPGPSGNQIGPGVSHANYLDIARTTRTLSAIGAFATETPTLSGDGMDPVVVNSAPVTATLAGVLRARPALGRAIAPEDDRPNAPAVALLGYDLWQSRFGGDSAVVGRSIVLDGLSHRVIGVLPAGFAYPAVAQLWTAVGSLPGVVFRAQHGLQVVGRLAPGASLGGANAELERLMAGLVAAFPRENAGRSLAAADLHDTLVGSAERPVRLLWLATLTVWLLACVNIAWLLLARAIGERQELAVRRALGSTARQLVAPWLYESLIIVAVSSVAGALGALWCSRWLSVALGTNETLGRLEIDARVLAVTVTCAIVTMLILTAIPALIAVRTAAGAALRGMSGAVRSSIGERATSTLIVGQVAGAVVLAWAALVLIQSLDRATRVDLGFDPNGLYVASLRLPPYAYQEDAPIRETYAAILEGVRRIPRVEAAAVTLAHPLQPGFSTTLQIVGDPTATDRRARLRSVSDGYFRTAGVRVLAGRDVSPTDRANGPRVAIVNESFVNEFLSGRSALGRQLLRRSFGAPEPVSYEVVGVVADERFSGPTADSEPAMYIPFAQMPFASANLLVRSRDGMTPALLGALRSAVWQHARAVPLDAMPSMETVAADYLTTQRTIGTVLAAFAAVAGLLVMIGIHGILAQTVSQRRRDLAIRRALGATTLRVVHGTTQRTTTAIVVGLIAGGTLVAVSSSAMRPFAFEVSPTDPMVLVLAGVLLIVMVVLGAVVPVWRAARLSPAAALRE